MSHRRAVSKGSQSGGEKLKDTSRSSSSSSSKNVLVEPEPNVKPVRGTLQLDGAEERVPLSSTIAVNGKESGEANENRLEEIELETEDYGKRRTKKWRESAFASGLTEASWMDERSSRKRRGGASRSSATGEDLPLPAPDSSGCLCCSAAVCPLLGADRVGNMAVLRSSTEWVESVEEDEETGEETVRRHTRPRLDCVVGPYWPMLVFVTYPIILTVSGWSFFAVIVRGKVHPVVALAWFVCTVLLIGSLAMTGCRDPGILYRLKNPPKHANGAGWRWSDRAQSYRPRNAHYDSDTAVIVEEFDHTCPWTGTAIGKKNMQAFQTFVCMVFVCLVFNIIILTGSISV